MPDKWSINQYGATWEITVENGRNYLICEMTNPEFNEEDESILVDENGTRFFAMNWDNIPEVGMQGIGRILNTRIGISQQVYDDIAAYMAAGVLEDHEFEVPAVPAVNNDPINYAANDPLAGGRRHTRRMRRTSMRNRRQQRRKTKSSL